jgi:hypothetical protein
VARGGGGPPEKVSPSFFKLLIFFLFRQVSVHQSPRLGWPEREETTAEGGGDLEKHCGRTLFSILSMDRLIDWSIDFKIDFKRRRTTLSSERSRHLGRVRSRNLSLVRNSFFFWFFVFSSLSLSFKVYMCICLRARAREKRKAKSEKREKQTKVFFGLWEKDSKSISLSLFKF